MTPLARLTTILARTPGIPDSTPLTMGGEVELEVTVGDLRWLVEQVAVLRTTLAFYADPENWRGEASPVFRIPPAHFDAGLRARAAKETPHG